MKSFDLLAHAHFQLYHPFITYTAIKFPHPILIPTSYKITLLKTLNLQMFIWKSNLKIYKFVLVYKC